MRLQVLSFGTLLFGLAALGCEPEIDDSGDDPCAKVRCKSGTHCEAAGESAQCVTDASCELDCAAGSHCELVAVQCVRAPCPPVEECVLDEVGGTACGDVTCGEGQVCCNASCGICTAPDMACIQTACEPNEENPCNLADCQPNTICNVVDGAAVCVPVDVEPAKKCAVVLCDAGTYCDDIDGTARCLPLPSCSGVSCEPGQHCELRDVQCVRAPCPPQPACVADADEECRNPCETVRCGQGTHCEAVDVVCIKAPCCPVAECKPDVKEEACGKSVCGEGTYCCNESCGICAPDGGLCIQKFCG